jgi:hypothetical protein
MKRWIWFKSLFTNKPLWINTELGWWYYRRGKIISEFDLYQEQFNKIIKT